MHRNDVTSVDAFQGRVILVYFRHESQGLVDATCVEFCNPSVVIF